MAQDVKIVILVTKDALLLCHKNCGERPYLFATIVANTKILLDIAGLDPKSGKTTVIFFAFGIYVHTK